MTFLHRSVLSILALSIGLAYAETAGGAGYLGCFGDPGDLSQVGQSKYMSEGYCNMSCQKKGLTVAAITQGDLCYCGKEAPSLSTQVNQRECDIKCPGYPATACGGNNTWSVYSIPSYPVNGGTETAAATPVETHITVASPIPTSIVVSGPQAGNSSVVLVTPTKSIAKTPLNTTAANSTATGTTPLNGAASTVHVVASAWMLTAALIPFVFYM